MCLLPTFYPLISHSYTRLQPQYQLLCPTDLLTHSLYPPFHLSVLLPSMHSGSTGRSATFCVVANILECLKAEGAVDIFRVIREIRMRQPHAVDREVGSNDGTAH